MRVDHEQRDRDGDGELDDQVAVGVASPGRDRRDEEEDDRDGDRPERHEARPAVELAAWPGEEREAEHEQQVPDHRAGERPAHDLGQSFVHGDEGDDQLRCVPERRVQEASDPRARVLRGMLRRLPDQPRQRDQRCRGEDELDRLVEVGEVVEGDRQGAGGSGRGRGRGGPRARTLVCLAKHESAEADSCRGSPPCGRHVRRARLRGRTCCRAVPIAARAPRAAALHRAWFVPEARIRRSRPSTSIAFARAYPFVTSASSLAPVGQTLPPSGHDRRRPGHRGASEIPLRPQDEVECRRCEVHCDRSSTRAPASGADARSCTPTRPGATRTWAACRRCSTSRSTSTCSASSRGGGTGSAPSRRGGRRCRCATRDLALLRAPRRRAGLPQPEFFELPLERPSFRVFATVD